MLGVLGRCESPQPHIPIQNHSDQTSRRRRKKIQGDLFRIEWMWAWTRPLTTGPIIQKPNDTHAVNALRIRFTQLDWLFIGNIVPLRVPIVSVRATAQSLSHKRLWVILRCALLLVGCVWFIYLLNVSLRRVYHFCLARAIVVVPCVSNCWCICEPLCYLLSTVVR